MTEGTHYLCWIEFDGTRRCCAEPFSELNVAGILAAIGKAGSAVKHVSIPAIFREVWLRDSVFLGYRIGEEKRGLVYDLPLSRANAEEAIARQATCIDGEVVVIVEIEEIETWIM